MYLARDVKHDRDVALKVLKPELAAVLGAERFVVEIKTTASLQHPHILPLFDSGTADGFLFYVMPYIQGETLRDRLNRETQLGVTDAVTIARDVAHALDYAHRHGVIHRDIKPENILLNDGRPMVADFGIALAVSAAAGGRMTETGLSLGTPHYMSPEQATADKEISARSDVYSLASVLYEMLAGQPPHLGGSAQQVIMKIITEPAQSVTQLRKSVPPNVAAAVARALEKLPADRFESAGAFARALVDPAFTHGVASGASSPAPALRAFGRDVSWRAATAAFAVLSAILVAVIVMRPRIDSSAAMVMRAEMELVPGVEGDITLDGVDVSHDGSTIVYSADPDVPGGRSNIYVRRTEDRAAHVVPGTVGGQDPAFSPDGRFIAFVLENRSLRRVPLSGTVVEAIAEEPPATTNMRYLRWGRDGFLYYDNDAGGGLTRVPERGGRPQVILGTGDPGWPDPLPDGKHVIYTECCGSTSDVRVLNIATGETRSLGLQAIEARYVPTGHLLLRTDDALRAVAFDLGNLVVAGEPIPMLDSVAANGSVRAFALSSAGTAVYVVRPGLVRRPSGSQLALIDLSGGQQLLSLPTARYSDVRFSPDGRRLAFTSRPPAGNDDSRLFVHDLLVGTTTALTPDSSRGADPVWTPKGDRVVFARYGLRDSGVVVASALADGSRAADTLLVMPFLGDTGTLRVPLSLSPDGTRLLLGQVRLRGKGDPILDLGIATLDGTWRMAAPYLNADWQEYDGRMSPDGRWVVYTSTEESRGAANRRTGVYARSFPEPGERFSVSDSDGVYPRWAPDGKTIYYWRRNTVVAVTVRTTPTFAVVSRKDLFTHVPLAGSRSTYDVHPDGKRFVMVASSPAASGVQPRALPQPPRLVMVVNWLEEFKRKLRVEK